MTTLAIALGLAVCTFGCVVFEREGGSKWLKLVAALTAFAGAAGVGHLLFNETVGRF